MFSDTFLTASDVARVLKLNVETVYALIANEGLPAIKVGGQWRFHESRLHAWLDDRSANYERNTSASAPATGLSERPTIPSEADHA